MNPHGHTRRQLLRELTALAGLSALPGLARAASATSAPRRLIVVFLRGAVDGLSLIAPHGDPRYYQARSSIALAPPGKADGLIDLDGYFGLHPACAPLLPFWQGGRLAVVHAAGSPEATRSHFDAQDDIETALPGERGPREGWLNRSLQALQKNHPQATALSSGPTLSRIARGEQRVAAAMLGGEGGRRITVDQPPVQAALGKLYEGSGEMSVAYGNARSTRDRLLSDLGAAQEREQASRGAPPAQGFALEARQLAQLLRRQSDLQLVFTQLGGWDTHVRQGGAQGELAGMLGPLSIGLATLASELDQLLDDSLILVLSEFGRTLHENGSGGTDHGHGNVMLLLGGGVAGGKVHGRWPGLDDAALFEGRDLAVTSDFRSVLALIGERHLQLDERALAQVFPKAPPVDASLRAIFKA